MNLISKVLAVIVFICGGMVYGLSQGNAKFFSEKPILSMFIAILLMGLGVALWRSKNAKKK